MPTGKRKRIYNPELRRATYLRAKERARAQGFTSPSAKDRFRKLEGKHPGLTPAVYTRTRILLKFRISFDVFESMRNANLAHEPEGFRKNGKPNTALAKSIQRYNTEIDSHENDWSEARVGYITSFYWAVTSPGFNYFSISDSERVVESNRSPIPKRMRDWTTRQYLYLVRYGGIEMDADDFDDRYGDGGPISQKILSGTLDRLRHA